MKKDRRRELICEMRKANAILGHTPSSAEMDELHSRNLVRFQHSSFSTEFATWREAVLASGLELGQSRIRSKAYSDEELISILRSFVEELGHLPTQAEFSEHKELPSWFTYFARFGGIKNAFAAAGYDFARCRNLNEECMIEALQALSKRLGRMPIARDLGHKNGVPCRKSFERIFGSWSNALKAAGLVKESRHELAKHRKEKRYDKGEMLVAYMRAAELIGHYPSSEELGKKIGTHSYRMYVKVFGSWQAFKTIVENA